MVGGLSFLPASLITCKYLYSWYVRSLICVSLIWKLNCLLTHHTWFLHQMSIPLNNVCWYILLIRMTVYYTSVKKFIRLNIFIYSYVSIFVFISIYFASTNISTYIGVYMYKDIYVYIKYIHIIYTYILYHE